MGWYINFNHQEILWCDYALNSLKVFDEEVPMGASVPHKIFVFGLGLLKRKVQKKEKVIQHGGVSIETGSSWPSMGWYAMNSQTIESYWLSNTEETRLKLSEVLGYNPWDISLDDWARKGNEFFRLLALLFHLSSDGSHSS